ncbi:MAG: hypothetical protein K6E69_03385 [Treponema sp.]|uniref:hypothetical protein n=1 Tax=Treponema sp. TaxID=166 RepID=UPI00298DB103|nr:hypothetical protein [Treponema sp.]MCR5386142.1 hypothetical protein [Treponema sp.]
MDGTPRGSGAGNGSIPSEETNVKINFGREALLYEGEADPRYVILPNFSSLNSISDYGIEKIRVYVDSTTQDFNISPGQTSIELRITQESHTIKLEGLDGSDKVVLKSDDWTGTITSGIVVPLGLKPFSQDASATDKGSVKLTINFPAKISGENAISYYVVKCDVDGKDADETGLHGKMISLENYVTEQTFTITDLDPGTHHVNITICRDNSFLKNATISFNAIVYAGLESSTVYDHSSQLTSAITYTHSDFETVTINDYAVCVKGTESIFVSEAENSAANDNLIPGTKHCIVYDTLADALSFVSEASGWADASEITIYINGTVTETPTDGSMVNISMSGKTLNLVGFKPASKPVAVLDADGNGRVLKVSSGNVVIKDLTLTGGNADNGGGIYCAADGVKITLGEGALIKSNTAQECGGGVYIKGSGTDADKKITFDMTSAEVSENTAFNNSYGSSDNNYGGGGIYIENGEGSIVNSVISENIVQISSKGGGGGVLLKNANILMSGNSVIKGNTVKKTDDTLAGFGGGVFLTGSASTSFCMYGNAKIGDDGESNKALYGGGVGLFNGSICLGYSAPGTTKTLNDGCGVIHNESGTRGGGIYCSGSSLYLDSGNVSYNKLTIPESGDYGGGGIFISNSCPKLSITGGVISGNYANQGGGICNIQPSSIIHMTGGVIKDNTVTLNGSGIWTKAQLVFGGAASVESGNDVYFKIENLYIELCSELDDSTSVTVSNGTNAKGARMIKKGTDYSGNFSADAVKFKIPDATCYNIAEDGYIRMVPAETIIASDFDDISYTNIRINDEPEITTIDAKGDKRMFLILPDGSKVALKIDVTNFDSYGASFNYDAWTIKSDGTKEHIFDSKTLDETDYFVHLDFDADGTDDMGISFQSYGVYIEADEDNTKYYIFN